MNLKETVKVILERSGIVELRVEPKAPIGSGVDHIVYPSYHNPEVVYKTAYDVVDKKIIQAKVDPHHIEVFRKYPDIFPEVHSFNGTFATIERLDNDKVLQEEPYVINAIRDANIPFFFSDTETPMLMLFFRKLRGPVHYARVVKIFKDDPIVMRYVELFIRTRPLEKEIIRSFIDFGSKNMGYTKNGILKLLDF